MPLTTSVRPLPVIVRRSRRVPSPQSIVADVGTAVHDAGVSTTPENWTVAVALIVSLFASATGTAINATAATTPNTPAIRRIEEPTSPVIACTPR